jgi:stalled ribosome rescue protein Dom34
MDPLLETQTQALERQLNTFKQKGQLIDETQTVLQDQLEKIYIRASKSIQAICDSKRHVLHGDEIELTRQLDQIRELETFLKYQRDAVDMFHLLFNWSTHLTLRQSLKEQFRQPEVTNVCLDLKIEGDLKIVNDFTKQTSKKIAQNDIPIVFDSACSKPYSPIKQNTNVRLTSV